MENLEKDVFLANEVQKKSYSPYSNFRVGAVLTTKSGKKYTGCNIENDGIQSICAERVAFCKAISEGENEFESILVVGGKNGEENNKCLPCGYCRQFMSEFIDKNFKIYNAYQNKIDEYKIEDLLPNSFDL